MKLYVLVIAMLLLAGCTREDQARRTLENNGYKDVKMNGYVFFGCDEKDTYHDSFEAVSPSNHRVTGVVCGGVLKKSTIRLD
jgi:major membrane immunogen (membrane-anchored lipoprotein)